MKYSEEYYEFLAKYCLGYEVDKEYLSLNHTKDGQKGKVDTFPDFSSSNNSNISLGLEVTSALSNEDGCERALLAKDFGKNKTPEEIFEDRSEHFKRAKTPIQQCCGVSYLVRYMSEDKEAQEVCKSIGKKLSILNCNDSHALVFKRNELFIFAEWTFGSENLQLFLLCQANSSYRLKFDTIYIKTDGVLYILDCHRISFSSIPIEDNDFRKKK